VFRPPVPLSAKSAAARKLTSFGQIGRMDFYKGTDMTLMNTRKVASILTITLTGLLALELAAAAAAPALGQAHGTWTDTGRMFPP
jgi:hypothetical protein